MTHRDCISVWCGCDSYLADTLYEPGAPVVVPVGHVARQGGVSDHHVLPAQILDMKTARPGWPGSPWCCQIRPGGINIVRGNFLLSPVVPVLSSTGLQQEELWSALNTGRVLSAARWTNNPDYPPLMFGGWWYTMVWSILTTLLIILVRLVQLYQIFHLYFSAGVILFSFSGPNLLLLLISRHGLRQTLSNRFHHSNFCSHQHCLHCQSEGFSS